ncbi:MAG: hypothetical protein EXS05_20845 [Planctomycetaceae bacterium]|nr:hypothetical protein [Planctomycetaceae bacterium]
MQAIRATWKNGQIVPDGPVDWPDGCRLVIDPEPYPSFVGMTEEEQRDDPESIARWIEAFDAIPPLEMTAEEEAAWQSARNAQREFDTATFDHRAESLRRMWE